MVIILQQSSDNGRRFISTVVEEDLAALAEAEEGTSGLSSVDDALNFHRDPPQGASSNSDTGTTRSTQSNCSSSFSLTSQHSISERSAIYKRRIDSLFGRQTKFNSFKPHLLEPFCVKIEDQNVRRRSGVADHASAGVGLVRSHSTRENCFKGILQKGQNKSSAPGLERPKQLRLCVETSDDDDDDYQKIPEENNFSSIVTDSLSNLSRFNQVPPRLINQANGKPTNQSRSARNVTSVRITCEENEHAKGNEILTFDDRRVQNAFMRLCGKMGETAIAEKSAGVPSRNGAASSSAPCSSSSADIIWKNGDYSGQVPRGPPSSSCPTENDRFSSPNFFHVCDLRFSVEYLGCVPVEGNTTALEDLQAPLCSLYTSYLNGKNILSGQLAITKDGLRFESPKLRLVNPFATIAVWAAIKFVARGDPHSNECAFMPLISDPEGQDKGRLFGQMSEEFARIYRSKCEAVGGQGASKPFRNPPLFACVMREATFTLDCHAFVCRCAEDAIVVAANLYQSLVDKMKSSCANPHIVGKREGESGYGTLTRNSPATNHANGQSPSSAFSTPSCSPPLSSNAHCQKSPSGSGPAALLQTVACCSKTSCGVVGASMQNRFTCQDCVSSPDGVCSDSESLLIPVRPPRRNTKKKHGSDRIGKSTLKRYNSEDSVLLKIPQRRVSIKKARNCGHVVSGYRPQYIKNTKRVTISTPEEELSSSSSAADFQLSESIDQVLDRIINPGGMSFNDLKPSYQQLLLKIALTLTQDQLYQKSKDAMKKHQLPVRANGKNHGNGRKKKPTAPNKPGTSANASGLESEEHSQFLGAFLKSFSKITSGKMMTSSSTQAVASVASCPGISATARIGNARSKALMAAKQPSKLPRKIIMKKNGPAVPPKPKRNEEASMMSFCSGCACENCSEKCYCSLPSKQNVKIIRIPASVPGKPERTSKSDDSESASCSKVASGSGGKPSTCSSSEKCEVQHDHSNGASVSGASTRAITTKMCGYDTESCAGSEKCYCSLQRVKSNGLKIYNINLDTETSDTDTNSYDLEAFNPLEPTTTTSSSSNLKTVSTKSVEILSYHPARRLSYCSNSNGNNSPGSISTGSGSPNPRQPQTNVGVKTTCAHQQQREGVSGNGVKKGLQNSSANSPQSSTQGNTEDKGVNQASPYFHSSSTPKGILCNSSYNKAHQSPGNKVRLVTGEDASAAPRSSYPFQYSDTKQNQDRNHPRGKIGKETSGIPANGNGTSSVAGENETRAQCGKGLETDKVLSMKKTAEIAAMFKEMNLNRRAGSNSKASSSVHDVLKMNSNYDKNSTNVMPKSNSSTDFQASLGYLP